MIALPRAWLMCGSLAILAAAPSPVSEPEPSRCFDLEGPAAAGTPHVFVPPQLKPRMSVAAVVEVARGASDGSVVTCLELQPPHPDAKPGWVQAEPWWAVHVEAPFRRIVSGAHGSCSSHHQMVFVADRTGALVSSAGIDPKCSMRPYAPVPAR